MYFILGIVLLALSFIPWILHLPVTLNTSGFFGIIWGAGYLIICDGIIYKFGDKTIPQVYIAKKHILIVGLIGAFLIEAFGNWIWKLWYYPLFSVYLYLLAMPFILVIYFYFILRGYLAVRVLLMHLFRKRVRVSKKRGLVPHLFHILGFVGAFGLTAALVQAISIMHYKNITFFNSYGLLDFQLINILLLTISLLFVLEFLEYKEREDTFLMHLLEGDWIPFASIIIVSLTTSLVMELFNLPLVLWQYTNWPYSNISLLGLPVMMLFAWPVQYLLIISIYHVMYKKETARIWD